MAEERSFALDKRDRRDSNASVGGNAAPASADGSIIVTSTDSTLDDTESEIPTKRKGSCEITGAFG